MLYFIYCMDIFFLKAVIKDYWSMLNKKILVHVLFAIS